MEKTLTDKNITPDKKSLRKERRNQYLCQRIKENDKMARESIIRENEGMIRSIVGKFLSNPFYEEGYFGHLEEEDLIQIGRFAIIGAAKKYNGERGVKFSTFAHKVIKNSINDYVRKSAKGYEAYMARSGVRRVLFDEDPDDDPRDPEEIWLRKKHNHQVSDPVGDKAVYNLRIEKLGNRILNLTSRTQVLIIYHYGLMTNEFKTYKETADHFHLNKAHAKNMIKKALKELKKGMNDGKIV